MINRFLRSKAIVKGLWGTMMPNSLYQFSNVEVMEDSMGSSGVSDAEATASKNKEDLALRYVREIERLAKTKRDTKHFLFHEVNRLNLNKELTDKISNLVGTHVPLFVKAIRERRYFKKMAVNFTVTKQLLELIDSLEEQTQKEASLFYTRKLEQKIEQEGFSKYQLGMKESLFRAMSSKMNSKLLELAPNLDDEINTQCILPFQAELQKVFEDEINKKFKSRKKTDTFCKKMNFIDLKMQAAFMNLVAHRSKAFQLLAYEYFYRKLIRSKFKAFTGIICGYSANPYKLSKIMRISPMVFRFQG